MVTVHLVEHEHNPAGLTVVEGPTQSWRWHILR
jgi:hypothetical protein